MSSRRPLPVIETTDSFSDLLRVTYRLESTEVDQLRAALTHAALPSTTSSPQDPRHPS